ncbi:MAG: AzlD domain-containing protein [Thermoleophilaceae bacterium]
MSEVWITIGVLCVGTVAIKSAGPLMVGGRVPSDRTLAVLSLVAPALLAALVVYETVGGRAGGVEIDERLAGVGAAAACLAAKLPLGVVVIAAAAVTALARALTG